MTNTDSRLRRVPGLASSWLALQAAAVLLLPKCPLCIAAWLSVWGVSAGAAWTLATYARPAMLLLPPAALAFWCWRRWRNARLAQRTRACWNCSTRTTAL